MIFIIFAFGIRTSSFQTFLAQTVASYLSSELNTEVRIDKVDIVFFDLVNIEGVYVEDKIKDTLLYSELIHVDIADFSLRNAFIEIDEVDLTNADVNIKKFKGDSTFNFQHFIDYFASEDKDTTTSDFRVSVNTLGLNNVNFVYQDQNKTFLENGMDYANLGVQNLSGESANLQKTQSFEK